MPVIDIPGYSFPGRGGLNMNLDILGSGRDVVYDVMHVSGDKTTIPRSAKPGRADYPREPAFRIVTSEGEVVHSGNFEYG